MRTVGDRMISRWNYRFDGHRRTWDKAKVRKAELKKEGFRVKVKKNFAGGFDIFIKDVLLIDAQECHGNGRVQP